MIVVLECVPRPPENLDFRLVSLCLVSSVHFAPCNFQILMGFESTTFDSCPVRALLTLIISFLLIDAAAGNTEIQF